MNQRHVGIEFIRSRNGDSTLVHSASFACMQTSPEVYELLWSQADAHVSSEYCVIFDFDWLTMFSLFSELPFFVMPRIIDIFLVRPDNHRSRGYYN
jgi:hypothetical protein